jgi:hypothetical protein
MRSFSAGSLDVHGNVGNGFARAIVHADSDIFRVRWLRRSQQTNYCDALRQD